jgi:hypothetical protein
LNGSDIILTIAFITAEATLGENPYMIINNPKAISIAPKSCDVKIGSFIVATPCVHKKIPISTQIIILIRYALNPHSPPPKYFV